MSIIRRISPLVSIIVLTEIACTAPSSEPDRSFEQQQSGAEPPAVLNPSNKIDRAVYDDLSAKNRATFWVVLSEKADLRGGPSVKNRSANGRFVIDTLKATANRSQAGIRAVLKGRGVDHKPFWIANVIRVTADRDTAEGLAARPEVARVVKDGAFTIPEIRSRRSGLLDARTSTSFAWNLERIGADRTWNELGDIGTGIVVGSIDTGVDFMHEALVNQYRGNVGGMFQHDYNWFDPASVCGPPGSPPCDNEGHGTHTMGTMVGGDGPGPFFADVGVAPGARWIAAKGCENRSCSFESLLAAGQWMLAPTDLAGNDPRPDLRPHVINNSWGGGPGDPFFQDIVRAWRAAGIFPAFSAGNAGPGCGSAGSPGDYPESFAAGATDIFDNIAFFSSRGPSLLTGGIKPEAAAPGVDVISSVPGGYAAFSGTSMASPHMAGAVALLWSASPALIGDIDGTAAVLESTAVDHPDFDCSGGGGPGDGGEFDGGFMDPDAGTRAGPGDPNNTYGDGRLDVFAAVLSAPRIAGTLAGTVTDAQGGAPLSGAAVTAVRRFDGLARSTLTRADGTYELRLPVEPPPGPNDYDVSVSTFGYLSAAAAVSITQDQLTTQDFALQPTPRAALSGTVRDDSGAPVAGATVRVLGTPIAPAIADASGRYAFAAVPQGEYDVEATGGKCSAPQTQHVVLGADAVLDFELRAREDRYGYRCKLVPFEWLEATTPVPFRSIDDDAVPVDLPFRMFFYGAEYPTAYVSTNGFLNFQEPNATFFHGPIPDFRPPSAAVYALWNDLFLGVDARVTTDVFGAAPDRVWVLEYRNVTFCCDFFGPESSFEVKLYERTGAIELLYETVRGRADGSGATVGIENADSTDAFQYAFDEPVLSDGLAIRFFQPPFGFVEGVVTDANDGLPLQGATVRLSRDGAPIRAAVTDATGRYRLSAALGTYALDVTATNYVAQSASFTLSTDAEVVTRNFALATGRASLSAASLELIVPRGEQRTQTLTISNTGSADLVFAVSEAGAPAASASPPPAGLGQWIYRQNVTAGVNGNSIGGSIYQPGAYRYATQAAPAQPAILIYADDPYHPAPQTFLDQALVRLGLSYTAHYNGDFFGFEMDLASARWDVVIFAHENFFLSPSTLDALQAYVAGGGKLAFHSWNFEQFAGAGLFGALGVSFVSSDVDPPDPIRWWDASHAAFNNPEAVPELTAPQGMLYRVYGQRVIESPGFTAIAGYTSPGPDRGQAAMVIGNDDRTVFKGFFDAQHVADLDRDAKVDVTELWMDLTTGLISGFVTDVPWLSVSPLAGTVRPGQSQAVQVTANAAGLAPGVYTASLRIRTNSGRVPSMRVPIRLIVPAYRQAVNTGGTAFTDGGGERWSADRAYTAGAYGYMNTRSRTTVTTRDIKATTDDALYQNLRTDPLEYRFDGLPAGTYQVELLFSELSTQGPGRHQYDVSVENTLVLLAHDVSLEVGTYTADRHVFYVPITDGQLNLRLAARRGFGAPEISAVRVTHRPDR